MFIWPLCVVHSRLSVPSGARPGIHGWPCAARYCCTVVALDALYKLRPRGTHYCNGLTRILLRGTVCIAANSYAIVVGLETLAESQACAIKG